jgi:hypothetical protein
MAIATVLKTVVPKGTCGFESHALLSASQSLAPSPPAMLPTTRLRIANAVLVLTFVLLAVIVYGMLQTPRPSWTRTPTPFVLVLAVLAGDLRRRARRAD